VSEIPSSNATLQAGPPQPGAVRRFLGSVGRTTRQRAAFALMLAALAWGVLGEAMRPHSWRRTVRAEFRRNLRQSLGGGLATALIAAALIGVLMVYQALYWLGAAGQEGLIGPILVTVLVREIAPVVVGLILLGRSGTVAVSEIGRLGIGGQVHTLEAQGIDPFQLLILPRACAFAVAAFTLGIFFMVTALITGFATATLLEAVQTTIWSFLDRVLLALRVTDFIIVPLKLIVIGVLVALAACLSALTLNPRQRDIATLLPHGFMRGLVLILLASLALSLAA